jgi:large subunit ribosomal protein L19
MNLIDVVNKKYAQEHVNTFPEFRTGDTIAVHVNITEGSKSRIQIFKGTCISIKREGKINGHFRVRKISDGVGVERVFPFHSPNVTKIEVTNFGKSRRAKHYYLRDRTGKRARIATDYSQKRQKSAKA